MGDWDDCPWFGQKVAKEETTESEDSISNKQKTKSMKPKPGTAKPSGKIGKGGPATSPTDGRSLNIKKKGGKVKKGM